MEMDRQNCCMLIPGNIRSYAERLSEQYGVRSGQGPVTTARSMSGVFLHCNLFLFLLPTFVAHGNVTVVAA
ncbi:MAG: hypothetical protein IJW63_00735 [Lachnospiraceae bacterium]|nr:hypothetical protein [Lachnospiraceae bacterium]